MSAALCHRLTDAQCDQFAARVFRNMGLAEVRHTWGCGLRAIQAEARQYSIPAEQGGCA
jgi:hypothetical protein